MSYILKSLLDVWQLGDVANLILLPSIRSDSFPLSGLAMSGNNSLCEALLLETEQNRQIGIGMHTHRHTYTHIHMVHGPTLSLEQPLLGPTIISQNSNTLKHSYYNSNPCYSAAL